MYVILEDKHNCKGLRRMLIKATREKIEQYMDFAYTLALDQRRSGYPLFSDGVSTKEQFVRHVWNGYENDDRDILLFIMMDWWKDGFSFFILNKIGISKQSDFLLTGIQSRHYQSSWNMLVSILLVMTYIGDFRKGTPVQLIFYKKVAVG